MKQFLSVLMILVNSILLFLCSNFNYYSKDNPILIVVMLLFYVFILVCPNVTDYRYKNMRLRNMAFGSDILTEFLIAVTINAILLFTPLINDFDWKDILLPAVLYCIAFWDGIIRIYITSLQLGIKYRVIGALLGMIPVLNIAALLSMLRITYKEVEYENNKILLNNSRANEKICQTKYPVLMVHGVFFRDFRYFNYWGRVPEELIKNGATVYYGEQESAGNVAYCGRQLHDKIVEIVEKTGCEKVNIIAHSKGGLDSRYAISVLGASKYVASLTTINTPHRGCAYADYLLGKVPDAEKKLVAAAYNNALRRLGDTNPDFLEAVGNLCASSCLDFNNKVPDSPDTYYQSVGSVMKHAYSGRFPLNCSHKLVDYFDGANDGLVGYESFAWGSNFIFLEPNGNRGISHADMIDLNRENIDGFDVREFYVGLVNDLKKKGF